MIGENVDFVTQYIANDFSYKVESQCLPQFEKTVILTFSKVYGFLSIVRKLETDNLPKNCLQISPTRSYWRLNYIGIWWQCRCDAQNLEIMPVHKLCVAGDLIEKTLVWSLWVTYNQYNT